MSVDLMPEWTIGDLCLTSYPFGVDADSTVDIGEPAMVVEAVTSMLADGDLERVVRHGNRTYVLEVYVEGPSLAELATSEALLRAELRRTPLLLTHDPGDGFAPPSVYEVQTAQLTPQRSDSGESHLIRKFTLTLTCAPFARSVDPVTVEVVPAPSVTPKQLSGVVEPVGTERTPVSIHVTAGDGVSHNGLTIVHTCPEDGSGYSPPLRRWRTSASTGPETTTAGTLSGKQEPIAFAAGGFYAEVPTASLPEGGYVLMARLSMPASPVATKVAWSTSTIFPDTTTQQGFVNGQTAVSFTGPAWQLVPLAALSLPSVRTKAGKVQIVIQVPTTDHAQVYLDDAWLFRVDDDCALTIVGHFWPHLWIDSPDATASPVPQVWMGDNRAVQAHPGEALVAMGNHVLSPEGTKVFTVSLVDNPVTEATFYPRWHSNAAG